MRLLHLADAEATERLGQQLAAALVALDHGLVIALEGPLGAGKTALARATIKALGHEGLVVSPTYTLLETYPVAGRHIHHLDLYRLADPEELEFIGVRELDIERDWFLVEWPDYGVGHLPPVDLTIQLRHASTARDAGFVAKTATGQTVAVCLNDLR